MIEDHPRFRRVQLVKLLVVHPIDVGEGENVAASFVELDELAFLVLFKLSILLILRIASLPIVSFLPLLGHVLDVLVTFIFIPVA